MGHLQINQSFVSSGPHVVYTFGTWRMYVCELHAKARNRHCCNKLKPRNKQEQKEKTMTNLEVAVFSAQDALSAQNAGAHRVELNASGSYPDGGLTPTISELRQLAPDLEVPVRIMIRPRGGNDFIYTEAEFAAMEQAVRDFKASGLLDAARGDGFVFGIVKADGGVDEGIVKADDGDGSGIVVDKDRCKSLVQLARPYACVYHRAFDEIAAAAGQQWRRGIDCLVGCGFDGLLTSGGKGNCSDNLVTLASIRSYATSRSLEVIAAGGVRPHNVRELVEYLAEPDSGSGRDAWIHSAAIAETSDSVTAQVNSEIVASLILK